MVYDEEGGQQVMEEPGQGLGQGGGEGYEQGEDVEGEGEVLSDLVNSSSSTSVKANTSTPSDRQLTQQQQQQHQRPLRHRHQVPPFDSFNQHRMHSNNHTLPEHSFQHLNFHTLKLTHHSFTPPPPPYSPPPLQVTSASAPSLLSETEAHWLVRGNK